MLLYKINEKISQILIARNEKDLLDIRSINLVVVMMEDIKVLSSRVERFKKRGYVSTQDFYFLKKNLEDIFGPLDQKERMKNYGGRHLYLPSMRRFSVSKSRLERQRDIFGTSFYLIILDQTEPTKLYCIPFWKVKDYIFSAKVGYGTHPSNKNSYVFTFNNDNICDWNGINFDCSSYFIPRRDSSYTYNSSSDFRKVFNIIESWIPERRYKSEEGYQVNLRSFLVYEHNFNVNEETGGSQIDILVENKIPIELKKNPNRSEFDRLSGQIDRHISIYGGIILVICRMQSRELLNEYREMFKERYSSNQLYWVIK